MFEEPTVSIIFITGNNLYYLLLIVDHRKRHFHVKMGNCAFIKLLGALVYLQSNKAIPLNIFKYLKGNDTWLKL